MAMDITSALPPLPIAPASASRDAVPGAASSFRSALARVVDTVDATEANANGAVAQMLNGTGDVHDAMIALQKAETTLELTVQVRNKLVQAYQDIMRMPV